MRKMRIVLLALLFMSKRLLYFNVTFIYIIVFSTTIVTYIKTGKFVNLDNIVAIYFIIPVAAIFILSILLPLVYILGTKKELMSRLYTAIESNNRYNIQSNIEIIYRSWNENNL